MEAPPITPPATFLDTVLQSILTPGTGPGLVAAINGALLVLLALLGGMAAAGEGDGHTAVMAALALGLLASVNWFISLVRAAEAAGGSGGGGGGGGGGEDGGGGKGGVKNIGEGGVENVGEGSVENMGEGGVGDSGEHAARGGRRARLRGMAVTREAAGRGGAAAAVD